MTAARGGSGPAAAKPVGGEDDPVLVDDEEEAGFPALDEETGVVRAAGRLEHAAVTIATAPITVARLPIGNLLRADTMT